MVWIRIPLYFGHLFTLHFLQVQWRFVPPYGKPFTLLLFNGRMLSFEVVEELLELRHIWLMADHFFPGSQQSRKNVLYIQESNLHDGSEEQPSMMHQ